VATSIAADEDTPFPSGTSDDTWNIPDHPFSFQPKESKYLTPKQLIKNDDK
jgi:hypothetical protein